MLCLCLLWGSWKCRDGGPGLRAVAGYRVLVWLRDAKDAGQRTVLPHYACESSKIDTTSPGVGPQSNSCVGLGMGWATRRGAYARAVIVIDLPSSRPSRWDWTPGEMGKKGTYRIIRFTRASLTSAAARRSCQLPNSVVFHPGPGLS